MPNAYSTYPLSMPKNKSNIRKRLAEIIREMPKEDLAEMISDALLDHVQEQATISVDCNVHGRFKHIPIPMVKPGVCPDCYFNDELIKEMAKDEDWIDPSKLN